MKVAASIVTYNPNIECLKNNINSIEKQVDTIYIVDNGSENVLDIESLLEQYKKISFIKLEQNYGIAKALNVACLNALGNNFEWILTLDQDSICPKNIIKEYEKYIMLEKCAMLASSIFDRSRNTITTNTEEEFLEIKNCITSGSLLNLEVWKKINGFDEHIFIDGVDFDICYRIIKLNYKIYRINSVVLNHEIGKSEYKKILKWSVAVMHHSSFRKYYIARNNIYLAKKGMWNVFVGILKNIKLVLLTILYEEDKKNKMKNILKGTIDGLRNK